MYATVLHSDMNCFYASVEMMLDPALRGKSVAVCGSSDTRHGIVLAKSERAKRSGIKTGMAVWQALDLCRDLILVPPQYDKYIMYSKLARRIYENYSEFVEPYGMDECFIGLFQGGFFEKEAYDTAQEIRTRIKNELGLSVSIGVSYNKIFAKLGSDLKKPDAVTVLSPSDYETKIAPLPVSDLLYAGPKTTAKLALAGIHTVKDAASVPVQSMVRLLGKNGYALWIFANGLDRTPVQRSDSVSPVKSVGHGVTCISDLKTTDEIKRAVIELSQDVAHRLYAYGMRARCVTVNIRTPDLSFRSFSGRLPAPSFSPAAIADCAYDAYIKNSGILPVRALTVRASELCGTDEPLQTDIFGNFSSLLKQEQLFEAEDDIRRRFGKYSVVPACMMLNTQLPPDDGRDRVIMPGMQI